MAETTDLPAVLQRCRRVDTACPSAGQG